MKEYIKKNINLIITIFILLGPLLDVLTGISIHFSLPFTVGIIIRGIFMIFIISLVLFIFKKKNLLIPYFILGLYFIIFIFGVFLYKNGEGLFIEIQNIIKVFYFPIIFISLYSIKDEINIDKMILFKTLLIYLLLIFIPTIFNIGYQTYAITKSGNLGFFYAANEVGGIISLLTPILFYIYTIYKNKIILILTGILYFSVILMMGTKTPLLTFFFTLGVTLAYLFINLLKKKQYKNIIYTTLILIFSFISFLFIVPKTNFYKNIEVHLDFLGINSFGEIFSKEEYIDHFIFSQRLTFLKEKNEIYKDANTFEHLFGIGFLREGKGIKQIEMDYFDIFYNYGIIGFIIYFSSFILIFYKKDKKERTFENIMEKTSLLLIFVLSFFTGHILTTPSVSFICIILIIMNINIKKKKTANKITV